MAFLAAHPAVLFGLIEGAVVSLLLRAPSTVGAMHIVGFHTGIAGLAVLVRLAIHRGALPAAVAVQVLLGSVTIAFLAVLIALFRGQLKKSQWHVGEQPHGWSTKPTLLAHIRISKVISVIDPVVTHFKLRHFLPDVVSWIIGIYPEYGQWSGWQSVDLIMQFSKAAQGVRNQFSATAKWRICYNHQSIGTGKWDIL